MEKFYIAIDLKSFYASVECVERNLDPLTTNLVVADVERTEKTICLAISPALKKYGLPGRARLFEVIQKVKEINKERKSHINGDFIAKSCSSLKLDTNPSLELDFIAATPRMALYIQYSSKIYSIYLKYVSPEDIHVYSIDEVFIDISSYLLKYNKSPEQIAQMMVKDIFMQTGITATAGVGTNMYLVKIAMDIVAKHMEPDEYGVRIAAIDEYSYRRLLWTHEPLTDFWRVGHGTARRLNSIGIANMGDLARASLNNEELLYKIFGINAELLIDHAWGYESAEIKDIKAYKPQNNSLSSGQVIHCAYEYEKALIVVKEMADELALNLYEKNVVTNQLVLYIGYDIDNVTDDFDKEIETDWYGRKVPRGVNGSINLKTYTSSTFIITDAVAKLFNKIVDKSLLVRRVNIAANHVRPKDFVEELKSYKKIDLFTDVEELKKQEQELDKKLEKEAKQKKAIADIKKKYGKNAVIKGLNLEDGATMKDRNNQIGGHKA